MVNISFFLHPCNKNRCNRVSIYNHYFNEINIQGFDFINGFRCNDVHKVNELNNLSVNIFILNFYPGQNKRRHNIIPIEISRNNSDRVIDLAIYHHQYALIKKLNVFLGDHDKNFICRRCLSSYTRENMLHKQK